MDVLLRGVLWQGGFFLVILLHLLEKNFSVIALLYFFPCSHR